MKNTLVGRLASIQGGPYEKIPISDSFNAQKLNVALIRGAHISDGVVSRVVKYSDGDDRRKPGKL